MDVPCYHLNLLNNLKLNLSMYFTGARQELCPYENFQVFYLLNVTN